MTTQVAQDFLIRTCPNCHSAEATIERSGEKKAEDLDFLQLKKHWSSFFKESCFFSYYRCDRCQFLYNKKFFSGPKLAELYSVMSDNTAGQNMANMIKTQKGYFDFLKKCHIPKGSFLEFGPDIGLFTEFVAKELDLDQHFLVEPNVAVHPQLIQSVGKKNYKILTDLFDLSAVPNHSLSLVAMIHVLDHMINPQEMMAQVEKKLMPGGLVLIVTHDEQSLLAKTLKHRWPAHCLQHPHLFNKNSIKMFLANIGYKNIRVKKSANYFSLPYLFQHLWWSLGLGKISLPEWPWMTLGLRLGNIITVAQKGENQ